MSSMRFAIAIAVVAALGGRAAADVDKAQVRALVAAGDTDYKLGKFTEALDEYARAYALYPAPALLFNLGQCHRNLKNWERAVFFYEGYLRESPADAPNRAVVEDLLTEARGELAKQQAAATATAQHDAEAAERARAEAERVRLEAEKHRLDEDTRLHVEAERRRLADEERARQAEEARRREQAREADRFYRKWWFWGAVGGAALAIGGTAYYFSGSTTVVEPTGSLGGLDRR